MQSLAMKSSSMRAATARAAAPAARSLKPFHAPRQARNASRVLAADSESNGTGVAGTADNVDMLDFDSLTEMVRLVHDTDIVDFELHGKGFSLAIKKQEAIQTPEPVYQVAAAPVAAAPAPAPVAAAAPAPAAPAAPAAAPKPAAPPAPAKVDGVEMSSPMAGTFYRTPAPGEPLFVKEGDRVTKGQTIGIIEAMKLMNEIEAEMSGEVVKFLVDNGSPISPGQALVVIRP